MCSPCHASGLPVGAFVMRALCVATTTRGGAHVAPTTNRATTRRRARASPEPAPRRLALSGTRRVAFAATCRRAVDDDEEGWRAPMGRTAIIKGDDVGHSEDGAFHAAAGASRGADEDARPAPATSGATSDATSPPKGGLLRTASAVHPTRHQDDARLVGGLTVGKTSSTALLLLIAVLYGSAVPVIYDPAAAAAWRDTPGLHTFVRSLVAACVFAPVALVVPGRDVTRRRTAPSSELEPPLDVDDAGRRGAELGFVVVAAAYCQWRHAGNIAPESFLLALALGPALTAAARAMKKTDEAAAAGGGKMDANVETVGGGTAVQVTQVTVALCGLLFLAASGDSSGASSSAELFEPWGVAAAVLFTFGVVRGEVLAVGKNAAARSKIAAAQAGFTALLAAAWALFDFYASTSSDGADVVLDLPLGELTYLGVLAGVVSAFELVAVNEFTEGYAMLAYGLIPITGACWQWLAGGAEPHSLVAGVGNASWGEVVALAMSLPPVVFVAVWFMTERGGGGGATLSVDEPTDGDRIDANGGALVGNEDPLQSEGHGDRNDPPEETWVEGVVKSVVQSLLKNPWWAGKVTKNASVVTTVVTKTVAKGAASGATTAVTTAVTTSQVTTAAGTGVTAGGVSAGSVGTVAAATGGGAVTAGVAATSVTTTATTAGGITGTAMAATSASAVTTATTAAIAGAGVGVLGISAATTALPECSGAQYDAVREAAEAAAGGVKVVAAAAAAAADTPLCSFDPTEVLGLATEVFTDELFSDGMTAVSDSLTAIGLDPSGAIEAASSFFEVT